MARLRLPGWLREYLGGAILMLLGELTLRATMPLHGMQLVSLYSGFSFAAGALFGWPGLAGILTTIAVRASSQFSFASIPVHFLVPAILAAGATISVRLASRRFGRIVTFPSYLVLVVGAFIASLIAAPMAALGRNSTLTLYNVWFWCATFFSSIVLVSPPVVEISARLFRPWLAEPWQARMRLHRRVPLSLRRLLVDLTLPIVILVGLGYALHFSPASASGSVGWIQLLFLVPVAWSAQRSGFHYAALIGCLAGLTILIAHPAQFSELATWHTAVLAQQSATLIFPFLGATLGWAFQRERHVRRQLESLNRELQAALSEIVFALRSALGAKHAETEDHVVRVSQYAMATARRLDMTAEQLEALESASLLHDIGKLGVREELITKRGPLTQDEAKAMRTHPEIGARLLERLPGLQAAAPLVLHHQERFDGKTVGQYPGYPEGLAGESIPLGSRIIAVVDAFDAMTSDRPYRSAMSVDEAIAELRRERGAQFDPRVVDAFLDALREIPWEHAD